MGIGMSTEEVAESLGVSTSRVSQIYQATVKRITLHFAHKDQRALDRFPVRSGPEFESLVATRESQAQWGTLLEQALTTPTGRFPERGRRKTASAGASSEGEGGETA
jgi:transcriptional regulator with XRE-family HTH domain